MDFGEKFVIGLVVKGSIMFDIITIGDAINDLFITPDEIKTAKNGFGKDNLCFEHGSKISINEVHRDIGGSACNVAVGMSRLGYKSAIIGATGKDIESEKIIARLELENVDTKNLKAFLKNQTNFSVIIVYKGERTVLVYRGLKDYSLLKIPKNPKTKWIYLGPVANSFVPNYKELIRLASEKNINIAINPGHRQIMEGREELKKLLYVSKVLILNKEEVIDLTKLTHFASEKELLRRLKSYGPEVVIITDGKNGAFANDDENFYGISAQKTEVFDSTGAGDAFSSGFLASYIKNKDIKEALKWGISNSTSVIQDYGAQKNLLSDSEIENLAATSPDVYNL